MLTPEYTSQFKKDIRRLKRRGKNLDLFKSLVDLLLHKKKLPSSYRDHALKGNYLGYRDAHIEGDWILIYKVNNLTVLFVRTGTHADLFSR